MTILAVLTTIDDEDRAREIAGALIRRNLAACVQISSIESLYQWEGEIQNERECRLLIKTIPARYADVEAEIRRLHTYDLPAIVAFETVEAFGEFADWVARHSAG